jgi:hypothetical protein
VVVDRLSNVMVRVPPSLALALASVAFVLTVLALVIVIPLSGKVADQAKRGEAARARQVTVAPIGCKQVQDSYRRGVISLKEMELYARGAPVRCAVPSQP